jgi:hypothetical protein
MPKGNPNPILTPEFKAQQFKPQGEVNGTLSSKTIGIKLPVEIDEVVRFLPKSIIATPRHHLSGPAGIDEG